MMVLFTQTYNISLLGYIFHICEILQLWSVTLIWILDWSGRGVMVRRQISIKVVKLIAVSAVAVALFISISHLSYHISKE